MTRLAQTRSESPTVIGFYSLPESGMSVLTILTPEKRVWQNSIIHKSNYWPKRSPPTAHSRQCCLTCKRGKHPFRPLVTGRFRTWQGKCPQVETYNRKVLYKRAETETSFQTYSKACWRPNIPVIQVYWYRKQVILLF